MSDILKGLPVPHLLLLILRTSKSLRMANPPCRNHCFRGELVYWLSAPRLGMQVEKDRVKGKSAGSRAP